MRLKELEDENSDLAEKATAACRSYRAAYTLVPALALVHDQQVPNNSLMIPGQPSALSTTRTTSYSCGHSYESSKSATQQPSLRIMPTIQSLRLPSTPQVQDCPDWEASCASLLSLLQYQDPHPVNRN